MPPKQQSDDPMELGDLDPMRIAEVVESKKVKPKPPPTELERKKEERLNAKEARLAKGLGEPPAGPAPGPPPPPMPEVDKSVLLDKLGAYKERFPHLKKRNNVTVKSSVDDILDEIHYCEMQLGSRSDGSMGCMVLHGVMLGVETVTRDVWNPLSLNLNGLARVTKDNMDEFQPLVDEMMIKYGAGMYMSVEMRLALSLGALVMTVHGANSGDPKIAAALEKVNASVRNPQKGKDL